MRFVPAVEKTIIPARGFEEIEMSIPGFTAEASLYNVSARYRATAEAAVYGGLVQPALSDRIQLYPRWCLKLVCIDRPPYGNPYCWRTIGIVNQLTGLCE